MENPKNTFLSADNDELIQLISKLRSNGIEVECSKTLSNKILKVDKKEYINALEIAFKNNQDNESNVKYFNDLNERKPLGYISIMLVDLDKDKFNDMDIYDLFDWYGGFTKLCPTEIIDLIEGLKQIFNRDIYVTSKNNSMEILVYGLPREHHVIQKTALEYFDIMDCPLIKNITLLNPTATPMDIQEKENLLTLIKKTSRL